jgi:hypothetical protein
MFKIDNTDNANNIESLFDEVDKLKEKLLFASIKTS